MRQYRNAIAFANQPDGICHFQVLALDIVSHKIPVESIPAVRNDSQSGHLFGQMGSRQNTLGGATHILILNGSPKFFRYHFVDARYQFTHALFPFESHLRHFPTQFFRQEIRRLKISQQMEIESSIAHRDFDSGKSKNPLCLSRWYKLIDTSKGIVISQAKSGNSVIFCDINQFCR